MERGEAMLHSARQHAPVPGLAPGGCSAWASRRPCPRTWHMAWDKPPVGAAVAAWPAVALVGWYELMTIIRGARVPQDLPGPAGVSAGAPEADPLRVRAAEVFADERILHRP